MRSAHTRIIGALTLLLAGCAGCDRGQPSDTGPAATPTASLAELADPTFCQECHPDQYAEWAGSMHAYAAEDPVFRAMNARGQRETNGELGDFCVKCHAPMAVELGLTTDGLNLDEVPDAYKGVTCYFCHQVDAVEGTHNNPLRLALDYTMRGGIADPVPGSPHASAYSPLHDRRTLESADLCGSCHDIVNPNGVHIERTYTEWKDSLFSEDTVFKLSCSECHMPGRDDTAAEGVPGLKLRRVHDHSMPGVDVALTDWPDQERQRALVQASLDPTVNATLCVSESDGARSIYGQLENVGAGHSFPSGATADRRVWVELVAYDALEQVVWSSGVVEAGEDVTALDDPNLWLFRDVHYDEAGEVSHMFWETQDYTSELLVTHPKDDPYYPVIATRFLPLPAGVEPTRITMKVRVQPIGYDVLDDLIASGDLDPALRAEMPIFDLGGTVREWTADLPPDVEGGSTTCVRD